MVPLEHAQGQALTAVRPGGEVSGLSQLGLTPPPPPYASSTQRAQLKEILNKGYDSQLLPITYSQI